MFEWVRFCPQTTHLADAPFKNSQSPSPDPRSPGAQLAAVAATAALLSDKDSLEKRPSQWSNLLTVDLRCSASVHAQVQSTSAVESKWCKFCCPSFQSRYSFNQSLLSGRRTQAVLLSAPLADSAEASVSRRGCCRNPISRNPGGG